MFLLGRAINFTYAEYPNWPLNWLKFPYTNHLFSCLIPRIRSDCVNNKPINNLIYPMVSLRHCPFIFDKFCSLQLVLIVVPASHSACCSSC